MIPTLLYRDAPAMIAWLCEVVGFARQMVVPGPDGTIAHAQLTLGAGMLMVGSIKGQDAEFGSFLRMPGDLGGAATGAVCVVADDPDAVHARAAARGAPIDIPPRDEPYGGRGFAFRDPEGHAWWCGSYDPWAEPPDNMEPTPAA